MALGENKKPGQFLCGFSMETEKLITKDSRVQLPLLSKEETAARIIDGIMECMGEKTGE